MCRPYNGRWLYRARMTAAIIEQELDRRRTERTAGWSRSAASNPGPRPGRTPDAHHCFIQGGLDFRIDPHRQKLHCKSAFNVATNELDNQVLPDERVIELYRKDQEKAERGFRFLKCPLVAASTLFQKTP